MQASTQSSVRNPKFIFVTGGVLSGIGKGIVTASIAKLLDLYGISTTCVKIDPYLNVDAGTMNPFAHGEVFVTDDGGETDMDIGTYERFLGKELSKIHNITTGEVYLDVIEAERRGDFLGECVQIIPNITNSIKEKISNVAKHQNHGVVLVECGGTVGDIESLPFLEAIRQFSNDINRKNSLFIHLTLVPYMKASGELKTKPTQHSVKELRSIGIQPDIIVCRTEKKIPILERKKISLFCNIKIEDVIETIDVKTIYEAPISFNKEKLDNRVLSYFNIKNKKSPNLTEWKKITAKVLNSKKDVNIGIVGKYVNLKDAYKSLDEALIHGGISNNLKVNLTRIDSEHLEGKNVRSELKNVSGILIPGGFGKRGSEGKIAAIKYARLNNIPFFGICFGMQMAIIEAARNLLNIKNASSSEFGNNCTPVVGLLEEWQKGKKKFKGSQEKLGGTMRLGSYQAILKSNSLIKKIYSMNKINERHRHRYEVNIKYKTEFEKKGLIFSALSPDGLLPEIIELKNHPWFVGVQFHPEFKSRPLNPHPLFSSFIKAAKSFNDK